MCFLSLRAPPVIGVTPESSASAIYSWVFLTLPISTGLGKYPPVSPNVDRRSTF